MTAFVRALQQPTSVRALRAALPPCTIVGDLDRAIHGIGSAGKGCGDCSQNQPQRHRDTEKTDGMN